MGTIEAGQGGASVERGVAAPVGPAPADAYRIALAYVPHGLCMFDARRRLVLCNPGYVAMYGLPARLSVPGTPLEDILAFRKAHGTAPLDLDTYYDVAFVTVREGRHATVRFKLADGRTQQVTHNPMPDGGYVAIHEDVTELVDAEDRLRYLAGHDQLTGLHNRHSFGERLASALRSTRCGTEIAILCLDLDRFKAVNDALGHHAGDMLLQRVAERLGECTDGDDVVGRLGGDEFIVMQPDIHGEEEARSLARRIVARLARPYRINHHLVSIGTSVGIALHPAHGATPDDLLKNADRALYMAKAEGGDGVRMFRGEPSRNAAPLARFA